MFLKIEGGAIINIDLISRVDINDMKKVATVWDSGIVLCHDSKIVYDFFQQERIFDKVDVAPEPEAKPEAPVEEPVQVGQEPAKEAIQS